MKIVNAVWEKRNIGVTTIEITIDKKDAISDIEKMLMSTEAEYIVVRLPIDKIDVSYMLQKMNYVYIETMYHLIYHVSPEEFICKTDVNDIDYKFQPVNEEGEQVIYQKIKEGMFRTDRIYVDPWFPREASARRYVYWLQDEVNRGAELFELCWKDNPVGFVALQHNYDEYHMFLYGIYPSYQGRGFSLVLSELLKQNVISRGGKTITTDVSSNNLASLRSRLQSGYLLDNSLYIYVKHIEERR